MVDMKRMEYQWMDESDNRAFFEVSYKNENFLRFDWKIYFLMGAQREREKKKEKVGKALFIVLYFSVSQFNLPNTHLHITEDFL